MERAVVVDAIGGPEVLRLTERDPGAPGAGQLRIRVAAAGVNFIDVYFRSGLYPRPLPFVAGLEGAGRVEAIGPGVAGAAVGDRVAWASVPGSYADVVVAPAASVVPVPDELPEDTAAAAMLQGMTAHYLVYAIRPPEPGGTALVHAAAGGTGLLLVQMLACVGMATMLAGWILGSTTSQLVLGGLALVVAAVVLTILLDWRTGIYFFLVWLLFEDMARKFLGNNMAVYFGKDVLAAVCYFSFAFDAWRGRTRNNCRAIWAHWGGLS